MNASPPVTVLVVDDHASFREAAAAVLARTEGFELVGEAADGGAAVRKVAALEPDLVLMDVRMPGLDGIAATIVITRRSPGTRVVLLSTYDLADVAERASACGAIGFLGKEELAPQALRALWDAAAGSATPRAAAPPD